MRKEEKNFDFNYTIIRLKCVTISKKKNNNQISWQKIKINQEISYSRTIFGQFRENDSKVEMFSLKIDPNKSVIYVGKCSHPDHDIMKSEKKNSIF